MKLQFPLKEIAVNQYFGNLDPKYDQLGVTGHPGMDFYAPHGTPVYAMHDGTANYEIDADQGHGIVVISNDTFSYQGKETRYKTILWHLCDSSKESQYLSPIEGKVDVPVKTGDLLGYADNTGFSFGDHLHVGYKPVAQGESNGAWYNLEQNNGYSGAIDIFPYLPKIKYNFPVNLQKGNTYPTKWVQDLQHFLYQEGFMDLVPYPQMGYYGPATSKAVLAYQKSKWTLSPSESALNGESFGPKTRGFANQ